MQFLLLSLRLLPIWWLSLGAIKVPERSSALQRKTLSIISITRNDPTGIRKTLASLLDVLEAGSADIEVIVVDGGEDSHSIDLIEEFGLERQVKVLQQKSRGLYEAMNEGLLLASGDYTWFLNGGDECQTSWATLSESINQLDADVFLFDYYFASKTIVSLRKTKKESYLWHALPTSHQAMLFSRQGKFAKLFYPIEYRVSADYAFAAQYKKCDAVFKTVHIPLIKFDGQGVSLERGKEIAKDAMKVQSAILNLNKVSKSLSAFLHMVARILRKFRNRAK